MNRRRALRATALGGGVVLVTAVIVVLVVVITYVRKPLPDRDGTIHLAGLSGKVTVYRNDQAVPQIYADSPVDLFRAQGYLNAEDRFFQMDLRRHITAGRLSELVGKNADALQADALIRTLGWRRVAEEEYAQVSPATKTALDAYSAGVNDYLRGRSASELSFSYSVLGRRNKLPTIEPWTPVDSLSWLKAMAWDLRGNYDEELERARVLPYVRDIDRVDQLYPPYPYSQHAPIIPGATGDQASADLTPTDEASPHLTSPHLTSANTNVKAAATVNSAGDQSTSSTNSGAQSMSSGPSAGSVKAGTAAPGTSRSGSHSRRDHFENLLTSSTAQRAFNSADDAINSIPNLLGNQEGTGSNSWVVSGDLTSSGLPLLANDPHLEVSMPGVWDQVGLHCNAVSKACPYDVTGYTFAGMPGVVVGHNDRIAWGMTNLDPDVTDFYLERVTGDEVEHDGKDVPLTTRQETIDVAGSRPVTITVRTTPHGPIISDVLDDVARAGQSAPVMGEKSHPAYAVSLAWTALTPGHAMDALLAMDTASDFDQFRSAALKLDAPAQNLIYADVDGHIGYQAPGRIPIRGPGDKGSPVPADGTWPQPGWEASYDWKGTVPLKKLPWVEDPAQGYIVAANQAVTGPGGTPVKITQDWDYGYRSQRIIDLIRAAKRNAHPLTEADMRVIQDDTYNSIAATLVPLLLQVAREDKIAKSDPFTEQGVDLLKGWDYTQPRRSAAAAYFNVVWVNILNLTFSDELPEGFKPDGGDRWFAVVQSLLSRPDDLWWDDRSTSDVVETRDEVMRRAMVSARLQLTSKLGKDPTSWQWGRLHQLTLKQTPLGGSSTPSLIRKLFNRGPYEAPGGSSIVDAFAWNASSGTFDVTAAPSMRMIVDLSNLDGSRWVNQTGESGHPGDSHYDDQIKAWLNGKDYPWPFSLRAVRAASRQEQDFLP